MYFKSKPDFEDSYKRYVAFFEGETIDRPVVSVKLAVEKPVPLPVKKYATDEERWLDVDFRAQVDSINIGNYTYPYDAMPIVFPNLGPEIFSAWCGCDYKFGVNTTWSEPCIDDWSKDTDKSIPDMKHPLFKTLERYTNNLLELGKGNFIVGLTDFHPGGDHVAALRDPAKLCIDLLENPQYVKKALDNSYPHFFKVYDYFYNMVKEADMPATSWLPAISKEKFYIPSCDFSYLIGPDMFNEFFLPGIISECQYYKRSIYHLDGPAALRHLDSILEIKELNAVQWVCGAGNEGYARWVDVYKKIQAKKKGIYLGINITELDLVFETLRPEGVWFAGIGGIKNKEMLDSVVKRIEKWK